MPINVKLAIVIVDAVIGMVLFRPPIFRMSCSFSRL